MGKRKFDQREENLLIKTKVGRIFRSENPPRKRSNIWFVQANGFNMADIALKEGTIEGFRYMNVDHYWSNDLAANHLFAGVKKIQRTGILRSLYGKMFTHEFPADATGGSVGMLSGMMFYSRVDIGHLTPTNWATLVYDINVV